MKHLEIERKFLLPPCSIKKFLKRNAIAYKKVPIEQFYLKSSAKGVDRYRRIGKRFIHTKKSGSGLVRQEYEESIDKRRYKKAMRKNRGGVLKKERYIFTLGDFKGELDRFKGSLKGLNLLEIEFPDELSARAFKLPKPFAKLVLAEVTEDPRFSNAYLSKSMRIPSIDSKALSAIKESEVLAFHSDLELGFSPYESTKRVIKAIFFVILRTIKANQAAILRGDLDPERLHQFRVGMRKLRALLKEMDEIFDPKWLKRHRSTLARLMKATSNKRDIDVYLQHIIDYRQMLPKSYRSGLKSLETYLLHEQKRQEKAIEAFLRSEPLESELKTLMDFARSDSFDGLQKDRASLPIIFLVKEHLGKDFNHLIAGGSRLNKSSAPKEYHKERIEIKKLRYLLEFFSFVFEKQSYEGLIKALKRLQTILGDHQDLHVQQSYLKQLALKPNLQDAKSQATLYTLEKIMGRLAKKRRKEFREEFHRFRKSYKDIDRLICRF